MMVSDCQESCVTEEKIEVRPNRTNETGGCQAEGLDLFL